jgi:hypothetical protein
VTRRSGLWLMVSLRGFWKALSTLECGIVVATALVGRPRDWAPSTALLPGDHYPTPGSWAGRVSRAITDWDLCQRTRDEPIGPLRPA